MILYRWRGSVTNFGDELNTLLWPALLPGFCDDNPATRLLGIGSVLDRRHDGPALKIVAGAGYGGYEPKPRLDASWVIHWVRGPHTARILGLPPARALGDPALLAPDALGVTRTDGNDIGFMPHFESIDRGVWAQAAAMTGITLIDPRDPPASILARMASCRLILCEALHGAIVADALRIPWVPLRPLVPIHRPKWQDWSAGMGLRLRFAHIPTTTMAEVLHASGLAGLEHSRLWRHLTQGCKMARVDHAAAALHRISQTDPHLSTDAMLDRCQTRQREALAQLRRTPLTNPGAIKPARGRASNRSECAYPLPVSS